MVGTKVGDMDDLFARSDAVKRCSWIVARRRPLSAAAIVSRSLLTVDGGDGLKIGSIAQE